jgi:clathrin heavy chain
MLFTNIKNNAKIASCMVRLGQYQHAIDSAKKANSPKTWKELCFACVDAEEFRLASVAGQHIIIHPDHLDEIVQHYEVKGFPEHMIELLQEGM